MSVTVLRTCTEIELDGEGHFRRGESKPLSEFRSRPALVLLGDPGAGKTTEFEEECRRLGNSAHYVTARNFVRLDIATRLEWQDKVLFVDGLDEMRAGAPDARVPLDLILNRLDRLQPRGFRISCREADWLGHNDRESLAVVSPDSLVAVVQLDPLSPRSVRELLESLLPDKDAGGFIEEARRRDIWSLLENPLTLELLVEAVGKGDGWPRSRHETFEMACHELATERNDEHRLGAGSESPRSVMNAAGYLCTLQLLAGFERYPLSSVPQDSSLVQLDDVEGGTPRISSCGLERALTTRLFAADGETGLRPVHRQIAEFLGARYLAKLVDDGLPPRRVTALMTSPADGRVATELRGLSAWLAVHSVEARSLLIDADPVGVGLYGDLGSFRVADKRRLLASLANIASQEALFGHGWRDGRDDGYVDLTARAFRSLVSADMIPVIGDLIEGVSTGAVGNRIAEFVLRILSEADDTEHESLADLAPSLDTILRDPSGSSPLREAALDAYLSVAPSGDCKTLVLKELLRSVHDRTVPDPNDQLRGTLMDHLYPDELSPEEVWRFLSRPNNRSFVGRLWRFWKRTLPERSSDRQIADLLEALLEDTSGLQPVLEHDFGDVLGQLSVGHPDRADEIPGGAGMADESGQLREQPPSGMFSVVGVPEWRIEDSGGPLDEEKRRRRDEWTEHLRSHESELRANSFAPLNLHTLALVYFGSIGNEAHASPRDRISDFIGGDPDLVDAAMTALQRAICRDDVPGVDKIVSWHTRHPPPLAFPVLASMGWLAGHPEPVHGIGADQKRRALAIYYRFAAGDDEVRSCHDAWFQQQPSLVLDVLHQCAVAALRRGDESLPGVHDLDFVTGHDDLVNEARLRLLEAFPTKIPKMQLRVFDHLLGRTVRYRDKTGLRDLVARKLTLKSLSVAQCVRWLAADALLSQGSGTQQFKDYVGADERRVRHLAEFLRNSLEYPGRVSVLSDCRDSDLLTDVVELLGGSFHPRDFRGRITLERSTSELISSVITRLSSMVDIRAREGLARLARSPKVDPWRDRLSRAREAQQFLFRDAAYSHPTVEQVLRTINDLTPANAADLTALLRDRLEAIADDIRGDSSNLWRQFWNEDPYGLPNQSKPEESCRDMLLATLKLRLPSGVDLQPEGRYVANKRSDIRASFREFNIPIEIKKNANRDLWSGIRRQLIDQYTTDPATSGYGIYLILWFGADKTKRPRGRELPTSPEGLRRLIESELTAEEARRVSVTVINVTRPVSGLPALRK